MRGKYNRPEMIDFMREHRMESLSIQAEGFEQRFGFPIPLDTLVRLRSQYEITLTKAEELEIIRDAKTTGEANALLCAEGIQRSTSYIRNLMIEHEKQGGEHVRYGDNIMYFYDRAFFEKYELATYEEIAQAYFKRFGYRIGRAGILAIRAKFGITNARRRAYQQIAEQAKTPQGFVLRAKKMGLNPTRETSRKYLAQKEAQNGAIR